MFEEDTELAAWLDGVASAVPWNQTAFYKISKPWRDLGYAVIPAKSATDKEPLGGDSWRQWCGEGRRPVPESVWREWCTRYADHAGLLLTSSSTGDLPDLVVDDVDDPSLLGWAIDTFGPTPLRVASGREGGGTHLYYQIPRGLLVPSRNGEIGPPEAWRQKKEGAAWKTAIDVKSNRAYVVATGSQHRTGLIYTPTMPITRETILSLPTFNHALYERLSGEGKPRRALPPGAPSDGPRPGGSTTGGTYDRAAGSPDAVIPAPGPYAGLTVREAATRLRAAKDERAVIGCPYHASVGGKSAWLSVRGSWIGVSCHVERVTYTIGPAEPTAEESSRLESLLAEIMRVRAENRAEEEPTAIEEADRLIAEELGIADRARNVARLASLDIGDSDQGETPNNSRCDRRSLHKDSSRLQRSQQPKSDVPPWSEDPAVHEEAQALYESEVAAAGWCAAGPSDTRVARTGGGFTTQKPPCYRYSCSVCGPRQVRALRAAARVILARTATGEEWVTYRISGGGDDLAQAVRHWQQKNPSERLLLTIRQTPTRSISLAIWRGIANMPALRGGALHRALADGEIVQDLAAEIDALTKGIDLAEWAASEKNAEVLGGSALLTGQIARLRDATLGRTRPGRSGEKPLSLRTFEPVAAVQAAMATATYSEVVTGEEEKGARSKTRETVWRLADAIPEVDALRLTIASGEIKMVEPRRRKKPKAEELPPEIEWIA